MKRLSLISDIIFYILAFFFLFMILFNYLIGRPYSYILSATFSLVFTLISIKISQGRKNKKTLPREQEKKYLSAMTELCLKPKAKQKELFTALFIKENYYPTAKKDGIFLTEKNTLVFIKFDFEKVNKAYIVKVFNKLDSGEIAEIYSDEYENDVKDFAKLFNGRIVLKDGKDTFSLLDKHGLLPEPTLLSDNKKKKADFTLLLHKKRAKNYLFFGLSFVILSYIVPIKIYYLVFGGIFLALALILRFFGKPAAA